MSESLDAFFLLEDRAPDVPPALERDGWGRPLIVPPGGGEPIAYTRMSTIAGKLEDRGGLETWKRRQAMRGVAITPELAAKVAALPEKTGNRRKDDLTAASWREYEEEAMTAAGSHSKASWGTAYHGFTEPGMRGNPAVPEKLQADVDAYWGKLDAYRAICLLSEVFVVNDELRCAGTFDDLYWLDGFGPVIGDKKSGKKKVKSATIQMAGYANAVAYNPETGERTDILDLVDWEAFGLARPQGHVNRDWALMIHSPVFEAAPVFYKADIRKGYDACRVAAWVRDFQSDNDGWVWDAHNDIMRAQREREAIRMINLACDWDQLRAVAVHFQDVWQDWHTTLGEQRAAQWTAA